MFFSRIPLISGLLVVLLITGCQTTPDDNDFARTYEFFLNQSQKEIAALGQMRAKGEISQEEYDYKRQQIETSVVQRANDRVLTEHQLNESYRESMGIPTPRSPPATIEVPSGPVGPRSSPIGNDRPGF